MPFTEPILEVLTVNAAEPQILLLVLIFCTIPMILRVWNISKPYLMWTSYIPAPLLLFSTELCCFHYIILGGSVWNSVCLPRNSQDMGLLSGGEPLIHGNQAILLKLTLKDCFPVVTTVHPAVISLKGLAAIKAITKPFLKLNIFCVWNVI